VSCAAAIAALPPPTAPPAEPVGAGESEATPLTMSAPSNACFGWEVQRKASLMRTFSSGLRDVERAAMITPGQDPPMVASAALSRRSPIALRPRRRERSSTPARSTRPASICPTGA
jgi:hypothetical protein